jgi:glutamate-1-semialdehyde 2,1-aminomutase
VTLPTPTRWSTTRSRGIVDEAKRYVPGGVQSSIRGFDPVLSFDRSAGPRIWDADGHEYIDYHAAFGAVLLGHRNAVVHSRVAQSLDQIDLVGTGVTPQEFELCRLIVEHVPSAEQVLLTNSGSEATYHAIRLARAVTGRTKIVKLQGSYHGWHDAVALNTGPTAREGERQPASAGILDSTVGHTLVGVFNDPTSVERLLDAHRGDVAAVIVEPVQHGIGCILPRAGFLQTMRELTQVHGAILIFDEVITGFRHGLGGFQAIAGVTPDLTTLGKAMGNGFPISALAGRRELMEQFDTFHAGSVFFAGTFNGHPASAAAAAATIDELARPRAYERLFQLGDRMRRGLEEIGKGLPFPTCVAGYGSVYILHFAEEAPASTRDLAGHDAERFIRYRQELIKRGVFETPMNLKRAHIGLSHTDADVDATLELAEDVLKELARGA